ncbi:MAG TPA: ABC transporter permease [Longimicrobiaceae bacterium]|nr:ABC transporter permease [Longimicrobiaceae bacterium]
METLLQDVRYALRRLRRSPGFTAVATLTLALGIGANSAIFSVVNGVLLRSLPYPDADRLVLVAHVTREGNRAPMSPANFRDVRSESRSLEELSFWTYGGRTLTGTGDPARLQGADVGQHFFEVMRARPLLGRTFRPEENEPGRNRVAVLGHAFWRQRFGADPKVVGRTVTLDGEPYEVVGVMPEEFGFPNKRDVWTPLEYDADFMADASRGSWYISGIGRLKPGVTHQQAAREIEGLGARLQKQYPETNTDLGISPVSLYEQMVGDVRLSLLVLLGAVGLVLLIACANVANLLLARAAAREGELAVRAAMGAGRGRLVRQLLAESVILGLLGGAAGLVLAVWGTSALVAMEPQGIPRLAEVGVDATVVAFTLGVALLSGVLFGLLPAVQVTRSDLAGTLREGGRGSLAGRGSARTRNALVVAEMALAVVLLAGAGLLIRSFAVLQGVDPGFRTESALSFNVSLPQAAYDEGARGAFYDGLLERLEGLPGVRSAAAVSDLPMGNSATFLTFEVEGREPPEPGREPASQILRATAGYFRTMEIPVVRGREFTADDRAGSPGVVVLNQAAAREFFPGEDPLGRRILLSLGPDTTAVPWEVVGVAGDVRQFGVDAEVQSAMYFPQAQAPVGGMGVVVRTTVPPASLAAAVRREVAAMDPNLPLNDLQPLERLAADSMSQPRFYMLLLSLFAGVALALAAIGIFGVISYGVAQRTREIGVRMALGAEPSSVLRIVVGGALGLAGIGVGVGVLGALAGTRLLSGLLFGVAATDPPTYVGVAVLLLAVAALASWLPARAAVRVDPMTALRAD